MANWKQMYDSNLQEYISCTQSANNTFSDAISSYNNNIRGQETKNRVKELAKCADKYSQRIKTKINENYNYIKRCLQCNW